MSRAANQSTRTVLSSFASRMMQRWIDRLVARNFITIMTCSLSPILQKRREEKRSKLVVVINLRLITYEYSYSGGQTVFLQSCMSRVEF